MSRVGIVGALMLVGIGVVPEGRAQQHSEQDPHYAAGYQDGYANRPRPGWADSGPYQYSYVYQRGYNDGIRTASYDRRRAEEGRQERQDRALLELYGEKRLVDQWKQGFRSTTPKPPDEQDPSAYVAYMEGYHAGQQAKAEGRDKTDFLPGTAGAEEARSLAELFVKQLDGMRLQSDKYYLLLEATKAEFPLAADAEPDLSESIAHTRFALERAKELYKTHLLFDRHAYTASRIHPRLVKALEARAAQLLGDIGQTEFEEFKQDLHAKADTVAALARRLAKEPVTVPRNFEAMGRYHRESIVVMGKALDADLLRETLAGARIDTDGLRVGMRAYVEFCRSWQEGQLREWRTDRLDRLYRSIGSEPSPGIAAEAKEQTEAYLPSPRPTASQVVVAPARPPSDPNPPLPLSDSESLGFVGWLKRICLWVGYVVVGLIVLGILGLIFNG